MQLKPCHIFVIEIKKKKNVKADDSGAVWAGRPNGGALSSGTFTAYLIVLTLLS